MQNYHIDVAPTEYSPSFDEKNSYTVRLPQGQMLARGSDFMKSLMDTARVAFAHNEPGRKDIIVTVPPGKALMFDDFVSFFNQEGCKVQIKESAENDFVQFEMINRLEWTCVDRRLDDRGAKANAGTDNVVENFPLISNETAGNIAKPEKLINPCLGQITHPGAIAFLHPKVANSVPPHHRDYLNGIARQIANNRWLIKEIVLHAGIDGASGCGGIGVANRGGACIETFEQHLVIVREVRDLFKDIMDSTCKIFAQLLDKKNRVITIDADDAGERREMLRNQINV